MGFNEYISELLFEHNCVIVPGFGGLVANTSKARINTLTHQIFPPCKTIAFNQKLDHNDGLLANHLVRKLGVTYDEAMVSIGKYSDHISKELKTSNSFTIPAVGNFYLNKENSIQFVPDEDSNFLYSSFGMGAITLPGIPANQAAILEGQKRSSGRTRKLQWLVSSAAVMLIAAACIFSFRSGLFKLNHNIVTLNPFDTILGDTDNADSQAGKTPLVINVPAPVLTETTSTVTEETIITPLPSLLEPATNKVTTEEAPATESASASAVSGKKFYIIGGAFSSRFNANRYRNMLEKKGFTASLAGQNGSGLIRVSYESFSDSLEAINRLEFIKSNENHQAWLLAQ